jgi:predicted transcriptional regulator
MHNYIIHSNFVAVDIILAAHIVRIYVNENQTAAGNAVHILEQEQASIQQEETPVLNI